MRTFYPASLLTFLNSNAPYNEAELWTITLQSGVVVRYTSHDVDVDKSLVSGTGVFSHSGPIIKRTSVKQKRGVEVSELSLNLSATSSQLLSGVPWMQAIRAGALDYAQVQLDLAVFDPGVASPAKGWYTWFVGTVARIPKIGMLSADIVLRNALARLEVLMPRNVVQPNCLNTWGDAGCGINKATWKKTGTVTTVNSDGSFIVSIPSGAPSMGLDGGQLILTSGNNANVVRKIKKYTAGTSKIEFFAPFVFPVSVGATFDCYPGCPGTQAACAQFSNSSRFRGMPYVPTPETVL